MSKYNRHGNTSCSAGLVGVFHEILQWLAFRAETNYIVIGSKAGRKRSARRGRVGNRVVGRCGHVHAHDFAAFHVDAALDYLGGCDMSNAHPITDHENYIFRLRI